MKRLATNLLPLLALASACGGSSGGADPAAAGGDREPVLGGAALPADLDVAALLYDTAYTVPDDFYVDERADTGRSYTLYHVTDETGAFELCTDDYETAAAWEADDNASRSVQGYYVGSYENDRYFEFIRELAYEQDVGNITEPTSPGYARVYKCSNTSRDGVDRAELNGYAGTLNVRPLERSDIRTFAEYLWQFTWFPARRSIVLDSLGTASGNGRTLLLAFATNQGHGRCDLVEVAEWAFTADPGSGRVEQAFRVVRSFEAEQVDGTIALCN